MSKCKVCERKFEPVRKKQRFCSGTCAQYGNKEHRKEALLLERVRLANRFLLRGAA